MSKNVNKLENSSMFSKLMKNDKFIDEILKTDDGIALVKKFDTYGVDLNQIDFSELCKTLANKLQLNPHEYELNSLTKTPLKYDETSVKTLVNFKEEKQ